MRNSLFGTSCRSRFRARVGGFSNCEVHDDLNGLRFDVSGDGVDICPEI